jgi:Questin oxidase-like
MTLKFRDGIIGRGGKELAPLAAQFRVKPNEVERRCAEMLSCVAYISGAPQRAGKVPKIDFFHMHAVTSSIFLSVLIRQPWISVETKTRLVEWKGRIDIAWYGASGCGALDPDAVRNYKGTPSGNMGWNDLYRGINIMHDDGHVAKFVRALKNGEEASKPFEQGPGSEAFPIKGDDWLKLARMAYDSTQDVPVEQKWVWGTGFDQAWAPVPAKS